MGEIADAYIDRILDMKAPAGYRPGRKRKDDFIMDKNNNPCKVVTGKCRLSYEHIFEPSSIDGTSPAKYSACIIIRKDDTVTLKKLEQAEAAAIQEGIKSKWKGKRPPKLKTPLRDGDVDREGDEAFAGCWFINANANRQPGIVDLALNPIIDREEVYSGCYCRFSVNLYPFSTNGNNGVAVGLNNVQKVADGERLAGGSRAEDDFGDGYDDPDSIY